MYLMPKTVVEELEKQRRTFFWQGGSTNFQTAVCEEILQKAVCEEILPNSLGREPDVSVWNGGKNMK
jgi:hypothetical protein